MVSVTSFGIAIIPPGSTRNVCPGNTRTSADKVTGDSITSSFFPATPSASKGFAQRFDAAKRIRKGSLTKNDG